MRMKSKNSVYKSISACVKCLLNNIQEIQFIGENCFHSNEFVNINIVEINKLVSFNYYF